MPEIHASDRPRSVPPPPASAAPLPAARTTAAGVRVRCGVPYADLPGVRPLELDLWLPPVGREPFPVTVFLHGGGWRLGTRRTAGRSYTDDDLNPFELMARAGVAVASVDYRLSGEAVWPAQLHDARAAVRWLRSRSAELHMEPNRVAAWGESAGGHLAALLGLTDDDSAIEGVAGGTDPVGTVVAVAAWYAPSDVAAVSPDTGADPLDPHTREAQLLGAPPPTVPDLAAAASPLHHVTAAAPPFLLLHGRLDRLIPSTHSERLHAALVAAGTDSALHLYDDADHMWFGAPAAADDAVQRTIAFLRSHLFPINPPTDNGDRP